MRIRDWVSFAAFVAIIVFALGFFASLGVRIKPPAQRTNLSMGVPDINGLVVGASVLLRGVPIGKVSYVSTNVDQASIGFYIDNRFKIPVNTDVRLENLSALGESFIELVPRTASGAMLRDGQRIDARAVTQPPSISELATNVGRVLHQLNPEALKRIISELDTALPNPTSVVPNLGHASVLVRHMATHLNGSGAALLSNFQTLLRNAEFVGPIFGEFPPAIYRIGTDINGLWNSVNELVSRGGPQTLRNFHMFLGRLETFLDHRSGDIKVLLQSMLPYLNDVSGALMNLDTGQLLENMLAAVPEDGVVTLHVSIPGQ